MLKQSAVLFFSYAFQITCFSDFPDGAPSLLLKDTKLSIWATEKCNGSFMWNGDIGENEVCAGYYSGKVAPCYVGYFFIPYLSMLCVFCILF